MRSKIPGMPYLVCGHTCLRHYPGAGSWAMMFVIRNSFSSFVKSVSWRGRCGAVHLHRICSTEALCFNIVCIGVHGAHGALLSDTFSDLAFLAKNRPYGSQVLILGDLNIDLLPTLFGDPWAEADGRMFHHCEQRFLLDAFADGLSLEIHIPGITYSAPGGPLADFCRSAPISRVPIGGHADSTLPSLLDFSIASKGLVRNSFISWERVPADHGLLGVSCTPVYVKREAAKTRWKCRDFDSCIEWLRRSAPSSFTDADSFHNFILDCQHLWGDSRSC